MSRQVQIRRGSANAHANFTGAMGEVTMDTTNKTLRVHDGITPGGTILAKQSEIPEQYTMPNNYDFVVESQLPTADNNYTWYRKYKSGWIEQGGYYSGNITAGNTATINLIISFDNTHYNISVTGEQNGNDWAYAVVKDGEVTTSSFKIFAGAGSNSDKIKGVYWIACGLVQQAE